LPLLPYRNFTLSFVRRKPHRNLGLRGKSAQPNSCLVFQARPLLSPHRRPLRHSYSAHPVWGVQLHPKAAAPARSAVCPHIFRIASVISFLKVSPCPRASKKIITAGGDQTGQPHPLTANTPSRRRTSTKPSSTSSQRSLYATTG